MPLRRTQQRRKPHRLTPLPTQQQLIQPLLIQPQLIRPRPTQQLILQQLQQKPPQRLKLLPRTQQLKLRQLNKLVGDKPLEVLEHAVRFWRAACFFVHQIHS